MLLDFLGLFLLSIQQHLQPFVMGLCKKKNYDLIIPMVYILHPYAEMPSLLMEKLLVSSEKQFC